jgi:hypothetical protein
MDPLSTSETKHTRLCSMHTGGNRLRSVLPDPNIQFPDLLLSLRGHPSWGPALLIQRKEDDVLRRFVTSTSSMSVPSTSGAMPPCGGAPYLKLGTGRRTSSATHLRHSPRPRTLFSSLPACGYESRRNLARSHCRRCLLERLGRCPAGRDKQAGHREQGERPHMVLRMALRRLLGLRS